MAGSKVDLPDSKPAADELWLAKDDTLGGNDADQANSDNSIPLSPQWLYAKPNENKLGLSAASGDTRPPNSLPQGILLDSIQKDAWRLDGFQDKKEWRRNVPDVEIKRRWREEERETSLLGRRESRKEGDWENEFRKNDRRSDTSTRESSDSRRHEVSSRNSGHESRRDSKWSSRWGPEDKDRDSRPEKKVGVDKEDPHVEKQLIAVGSRPLSESDTRDKWRPRHRQDGHSGGAAVYRAAPGFGVERGQVVGSNVGFALGRGRLNFIGGLPLSRSSSGPIGAAPITSGGSLPGKSNLSANTFRYPRGKLLDIYRNQKVVLSFETTPEGFEDAPPITHSGSIAPLAFVKPDVEEEADLENMWKTKRTSTGVCYDSNREGMPSVRNCKIEPEADNGEHKDNINALSNVYHHPDSIISTASKDGASFIPGSITRSEEVVCQSKVENVVGHPGISDFLTDAEFGALNSSASFDVCNNLTSESGPSFGTSFGQVIPGYISQQQNRSNELDLLEQGDDGDVSLFYRDPEENIQGPFLIEDIMSWYDEGYFGTDLLVCLSNASSEGMTFRPLGEVLSQLSLRHRSSILNNPVGQSGSIEGKLDDKTLASEFSSSFPINDQQLVSSGSDDSVNQVQMMVSEHEVSVGSRFQKLPYSSSEGSVAATGYERHNLNEFSRQDLGEVMYNGRPASNIQNPLEMPAHDVCDLSQTSSGDHFPISEMTQSNYVNHNMPPDADLNPLGLSWSELEGIHQKGPLSSKIAGVGDQDLTFNPLLGQHKQDGFSLIDDTSVVRDAWSSNYRKQSSSTVRQDAMDSSNFPYIEPESTHFNLNEHLLSQQLENQQQLLSSPHENMSFYGSVLDRVQGSVQHGQSTNQSTPDIEHLHMEQQRESIYQSSPDIKHLLKLHMEQQRESIYQSSPDTEHLLKLHIAQRRHLQQFEQQQKIHQRNQQLHHQMQLLQQEHQQQLFLEQLLLEHQQEHQRVLYRQRLLHELQNQARHFPWDHEPSLDQLLQTKFSHNLDHDHHGEFFDATSNPRRRHMLPFEQQYLIDLQQEQMLARQFPIASRQPLGMEEERHVDGAWSVDESGHFIRSPTNPQQTHSRRLGELDYIQPQQTPSSLKQPSHLERNFLFHDPLQQHNYEESPQVFEKYSGATGLHMGQLNTLAHMQGMDIQEQHGLFYDSLSSHHDWMSNQSGNSHLDAMKRGWSEHNGQLGNSLMESQFNLLNLEAEKQKREMKANLSSRELNQWSSLLERGENPNHGFANILGSQSLGSFNGAPTSSYENRGTSSFFSPLTTDDSISHAAARRPNSGALFEHKQVFPDMEEFEREQFGDSLVGRISRDVINYSNVSEGSMVKKHGSNGLTMTRSALDTLVGGVDQAGASRLGYGDLEVNVPVRHASFGNTGGGVNMYNYRMGADNTYMEEMVTDRMLSKEASFVEMLRSSTKKPESDSGSVDPGVRKKKGKKGRQIDPSLLGFKVHSNRILMGEIHRPDD